MAGTRSLSADAARRMALAAQGFGRPRPSGRVSRQHLRRMFEQIGLVQIDSVNVLVRSQELPLFSRLGPHPRQLIPDAMAKGELFEYWAHAASVLPTGDYRLWRWRMDKARNGEGYQGFAHRKRPLIDSVLEQVRERGPLTVSDLEGRVRNRGSTWWDWDDGKMALEWLFETGLVGATRRARDFARLYDLSERVIPAAALAAPAPAEPEARRALLLLAARSLGVATLGDLANYHGQRPTTVKPIVAELVASGELVAVVVEGWDRPGLMLPEARAPRTVTGRALLTPFDPLVWHRDRVERIFDFAYRIEIYTPEPKRVFGYYVLPFLLDGHLVGRVDLKADRAAGVLRVQAAFVEDDLDTPADRPHIAEQLAAELADMATWLDLPAVGAVARGNLAADLLATGVEPLG